MWEMFYLGMNQGEEEEEEEGQVQLSGDLGGRLGGDLGGHLGGDLAGRPGEDLAGRPGEDPHQQDPNHRSKTGVEGLSTGNNFGLKSVFHFFPLGKDFLEDLVVFEDALEGPA